MSNKKNKKNLTPDPEVKEDKSLESSGETADQNGQQEDNSGNNGDNQNEPENKSPIVTTEVIADKKLPEENPGVVEVNFLTPYPEVKEDKSLVKVQIGYPENYKGKKFFTDGDIKGVSRQVADQFIELGIATEVKQ